MPSTKKSGEAAILRLLATARNQPDTPDIHNNDHLNATFDRLNVSEDVRRRLAQPMQTVQVNIPVRVDDGSLQFFQVWHIQYNDARGPTKGGISGAADRALAERGVQVLPDVLVNAGGVIVSHLEWVQNRMGDTWYEEEINQRLAERLGCEADSCFQCAEETDTTLRSAAYMQAIGRIDEAIEHQGTREYFTGTSL